MSELRPGQGADAFSVRFPPGMRDRIKATAEHNGRSMNAEIIATLAEKYPAASLDVRAIDSVLNYVANAPTDRHRTERIVEVNVQFEAMGSLLRVDLNADGKLTIITEL